MKIVTVPCAKCRKELHILEEYVKEEMYCTVQCMETEHHQEINTTHHLR